MIDDLKWSPMWTTLIGCTKGCLDHLGVEVSIPWLFGGTGHAFLLNFGDNTCASHPTAWKKDAHHRLGRNVGYATREIAVEEGDDIDEKKRLAWDEVRAALDGGRACVGWGLEVEEFYVVNGYDDTGYHFRGPLADEGKGPKDWREQNWLYMLILEPAPAADERIVVREALEYALELTHEPARWTFEERRTGLAGYDNWIASARALPGTDHSGHGMAYNSMVWPECRRSAVAFLEEAKQRLAPAGADAFDEALGRYREVSGHLSRVEKLFPWRPDAWDENARDAGRLEEVAAELEAARASEASGLEALAEVLKAL